MVKSQRIGCFLAGLLAALIGAGGCGLGWDLPRTPTRPDNVDQEPNDPPGNDDTSVRVCVGLGTPRTVQHTDMFNRLNAYREVNGLARLAYSRTLETAADRYAVRLSIEDFFDHVAPDGSTPPDRAVEAGFCDRFVGENLAYGLNNLASAEAALQGFKDSPGHNENMLRPEWDYVGIGYFAVPRFDGTGTEYWWVQLFGTEQEAP